MSLPSAIEAALTEAGFSGSELSILKRLLEDDALTLRELASKAGKSTGALDQGVKKLLKKGIVVKEEINGSPKYVLGSLEAIRRSIEQDMKEKKTQLQRRHDTVEAFLASITHEKQRPDLQHFVGADAMKQAYIQLLSYGARELLHFLPEPKSEGEDPLREFHIQYFRMRRQKEIFSRVLANDTPLGRRYQSRDPFEFRKTVLLPVALVSPFEKIIAGNTVACFDHEKMTACFIHFPELAQTERAQFEHLWGGAMGVPQVPQLPIQNQSVPSATKWLSGLRSFFLGKLSFYSFLLFAIASWGITFGLYRYAHSIATERIQERAMAIAATAAPRFSIEDLSVLHSYKDIKRPEYKKVLNQLNDIRDRNEGLDYLYILKSSSDPGMFIFVADADSFNPRHLTDVNGDGTVNEEDQGIAPGEYYDISGFPKMAVAMFEGRSSAELGRDKWGEFVSGYAPIGADGDERYILGIDIFTRRIEEQTRADFAPWIAFISIMLLFIGARFLVMHYQLVIWSPKIK